MKYFLLCLATLLLSSCAEIPMKDCKQIFRKGPSDSAAVESNDWLCRRNWKIYNH